MPGLMLRGTKDFKSFCKAPSHEFGCPDISNVIQPLLKLSHRLGHRHRFSTTAASWKTLHDSHLTVLNRAIWREIQQMCRDTGFFSPLFILMQMKCFPACQLWWVFGTYDQKARCLSSKCLWSFLGPLLASIASLLKIKKEQRIMAIQSKNH